MRKPNIETVEFDKGKQEVVVFREERLNVKNAKDLTEAKAILRKDLMDTVAQIKMLKAHAQEVRDTLAQLE
ncbi:MAG: hypothetical protein U1D96_03500 [Eubacteriales bacterium]|nr:hypothetical protein [Eubacteriales bacterium]